MSKEPKYVQLAKKYELHEKLGFDHETGLPKEGSQEVIDGIFEGEGVTLDMIKKVDRTKAAVHAAVTNTVGEDAVTVFKSNKELNELSFNYTVGGDKVSTVFSRSGENPIVSIVETSVSSVDGELKKVYKNLKAQFKDINS